MPQPDNPSLRLSSPMILGCVKLIIRTNTTFLPPLPMTQHFPNPNNCRQSLCLSLATADPAAAPESSVVYSAAPMLEMTQG